MAVRAVAWASCINTMSRAAAKVIHVILDNYKIHDSKLVAWGLLQAKGRIELHFLPPLLSCVTTRSRGLWEDLHAEVTRNHKCPDIDDLMAARSRLPPSPLLSVP